MYCIYKKKDITKLANWRGISLLAAAYKLYEALLWTTLERTTRRIPKQLVGFQRGRTTAEISEGFRTLLQKAQNWGKPMAVVSMDISAAFDWMQ